MIGYYDEINLAQNILQNGFQTNRIGYEISVVCKYLYGKSNDKKIVEGTISRIIDTYAPEYKSIKRYGYIRKIINGTSDKRCKHLDFVPITNNDLIIIDSIKDINQAKVLFVLICMAKINRLFYSNTFVNEKFTIISKISKISNQRKMCEYIKKLIDLGHVRITLSGSIEVLCLTENDNSEIRIRVVDFENCGYYYSSYKNNDARICECNRIYLKRNGRICCNVCSAEKEKERYARYNNLTRKPNEERD